jgi:hypothetical protein
VKSNRTFMGHEFSTFEDRCKAMACVNQVNEERHKLTGQGRKSSTPAQRVEWLLEHPEYISKPLSRIMTAMQRAGLYAPSSSWGDCRSGLEEAVKIAKRKR